MSSHSSQMANGTIWNALERFSVLGIQMICTFIMARFLTPADFGLMGMLVVFTLFGNVISESGFSQALIREKEVSDLTLSTVFWTNLLLSLLIYGLLWLTAPYIADFYNEPLLTSVSRWTFLVIPLTAISLIQVTWYTRQLEFKHMCLITFSASLISCIVAVIIAWQYHSVWALVIQAILTYLLRSLFFWISAKWHPLLKFSKTELKRLFHFSQNLLITGIVGTFFNNIYTILIGRFYGATETGFFAQADRMRMVVSSNSTNVVKSVSFPILSQVNNEEGDLRNAYRKVILIALMSVGFVMTLLMCVSEDLFQLLMGAPEWRRAGQYFFIIGIAGILFPLHSINENVLLVKGKGRTLLGLEIARRTLMVFLIVVTIHFDIDTFIWSYALYSFLLIFINLRVCGQPIGYKLKDQLRDIFPILCSFAFMLIFAGMCNHFLSYSSTILRLFITLLLSASLGIVLLYRHRSFQDLIDLLHKNRS